MVRRSALLCLVLTILIGLGLSDRAHSQTEVTLDVFYDALSPYGEWVEHEYYGYIWQPVGVDPYWKPYSDGNWQYSDEGWIWVSGEPWGWATYHYGRWMLDDYYGWIWIPGVTWAPAYVDWYESPGYVGWSPQPPDTSFFLSIGIAIGTGYGYYSPYYYEPYYYGGHGHHKKHYGKHYRKKHHYGHHYGHHAPDSHSTYVPDHHFSHKNAKLVALDRPHNLVVHRNSKAINNVKVENNRIVNRGPDRRSMERRTGRKIGRVNIVDRNSAQLRGNKSVNNLKGGDYNIYRPTVVKRGDESPRKVSKRSAGADNTRVERGDNQRERNKQDAEDRSGRTTSRGTDKSTNGNRPRADNRTRTYKSGADGKYREVTNDRPRNQGVQKTNSGSRGNGAAGKNSNDTRANVNTEQPARTGSSNLSRAKSYETHTNRQNNVKGSKQKHDGHYSVKKSAYSTNRVRANPTQTQYKSNGKSNLSGNTANRVNTQTPANVKNNSRNTPRGQPANTGNYTNRQVKQSGRTKTYKPQPRAGSNTQQHQSQNYQKSRASNQAQKSVNTRNVSNRSSYRSAPAPSVTRSAPVRSYNSSPVNRNYNSYNTGGTRQTYRNSYSRKSGR